MTHVCTRSSLAKQGTPSRLRALAPHQARCTSSGSRGTLIVSACQGWRGWSPFSTVTSTSSSSSAVISPSRHQRRRSSSAFSTNVAVYRDGEPLTHKSLAHIYERWLPGLGILITAHRLRHSFTTAMLRHSADIRAIQDLMGHTSPETTQRYLAFCNEQLRGAIEKLPCTWCVDTRDMGGVA